MRRRAVLAERILRLLEVLVSVLTYLVVLHFRDLATHVELPTWMPSAIVNEWQAQRAALPDIDVGVHQFLLVAWLPLWVLTLRALSPAQRHERYLDALGRYAKASIVAMVLFLTVVFVFKLDFVSRGFVGGFALLQFPMLAVVRTLWGWVRRATLPMRARSHRVLVVGQHEWSASLAARLDHATLVGCVSVEDAPGHDADASIGPLLGSLDAFVNILDAHPADEVWFAPLPHALERFATAIAVCDDRGVDVVMPLPHALERGRAELASMSGFGLPVVGLRGHQRSEAQLLVKRMVDVFGAAVLLLLLAPLWAVVLVRQLLGQRVLATVPCLGRAGRVFGRLVWASGGPSRAPALLHVLTGKMSFVGPTPAHPDALAGWAPWQRRKLAMAPGLLNPARDAPAAVREQADLTYVDHWSLRTEMRALANLLAPQHRSGS